jgi:hypothetical protein
MEMQDEQSRRKNMMFFGVREENKETWEVTEQKIREVMEITMGMVDASSDTVLQIERAQRLGQRTHNKTRPILVRFMHEKQRNTVMEKARKKLRNTDIRVGEDFSKRVREVRQKLYPKMMDARAEGRRANIRYDKLHIGDTVYALGDDGQLNRVGETRH